MARTWDKMTHGLVVQTKTEMPEKIKASIFGQKREHQCNEEKLTFELIYIRQLVALTTHYFVYEEFL